MRLAISNIAWRPDERLAVHALLAELGVTGLEIAPGLTFPGEDDAFDPSEVAVAAFRADLDDHGLTAVSMQSLLFGVTDAQLFGDGAEQAVFEAGVGRAIRLAGRLGIPNLVLGSPANRSLPSTVDRAEAERRAADLFRRLGDACVAAGCRLALEPNPVAYRTNFLNTFDQAVAFTRAVDHPGVAVNLDLGAMRMNEDAVQTLTGLDQTVDLISHVHISEPHLAAVTADAELEQVLARLRQVGYAHAVSIEMRADTGSNLDRVRDSVIGCMAAVPDSASGAQAGDAA